jgi:MFS family permease
MTAELTDPKPPTPSSHDPSSPAGLGRITAATLGVTGVVVLSANPIVVALPAIGSDLGSVGLLGWVLSTYVLGTAIGLLIAGRVVDSIGARRTFRGAVLWYLIATLLCVMAPSLPLLLILRVFQGLGSGFIQAVAFATIALAYPPHLRSKMFAANSALWGIAGFVGPTLGTLVVALSGWRAAFAINIPMAVIAASLGWHVLPGRRADSPKLRIDLRGIFLLGVATALLLWGFGTFDYATPLVLLAAGATVTAYWIHSGRAEQPVIPRPHLIGRPNRWLNTTGLLAFAVPWGLSSYVPVVAIVGLGLSPAIAAGVLTTYAGGWVAGSVTAGTLHRQEHPARMLIIGCSLMLIGATAGTATWNEGVPVVVLGIFGSIAGLGGGITNNVSITLTQALADPLSVGRTLSSFQYVRNFGSAGGAALTGAIIFGLVAWRSDLEDLRRAFEGGGHSDTVATFVLQGSRVAHLVATCLAALALIAALRLSRWTSSDEFSKTPSTLQMTTNPTEKET